jgi:hypothetical protein
VSYRLKEIFEKITPSAPAYISIEDTSAASIQVSVSRWNKKHELQLTSKTIEDKIKVSCRKEIRTVESEHELFRTWIVGIQPDTVVRVPGIASRVKELKTICEELNKPQNDYGYFCQVDHKDLLFWKQTVPAELRERLNSKLHANK